MGESIVKIIHQMYILIKKDSILINFYMVSTDTLVIIGDYDEFENAVKLVIDNVKFDNNIIVSVFETNIRMVG